MGIADWAADIRKCKNRPAGEMAQVKELRWLGRGLGIYFFNGDHML